MEKINGDNMKKFTLKSLIILLCFLSFSFVPNKTSANAIKENVKFEIDTEGLKKGLISDTKDAIDDFSEKHGDEIKEKAEASKGFFKTLWEKIKEFFINLFTKAKDEERDDLAKKAEEETKKQNDAIKDGIMGMITDKVNDKIDEGINNYLTDITNLTGDKDSKDKDKEDKEDEEDEDNKNGFLSWISNTLKFFNKDDKDNEEIEDDEENNNENPNTKGLVSLVTNGDIDEVSADTTADAISALGEIIPKVNNNSQGNININIDFNINKGSAINDVSSALSSLEKLFK